MHRLLCNALIQPLFDYAYTAWFSNLSKRLQLHLQASENKWLRLSLQLDKTPKICVEEFLQLNWLNVHDRNLQFIVSDTFKFQNNQSPSYFDALFCPFRENDAITSSYNKKLKLPFKKMKLRIQSLSYLGHNTWNNLSNNLKFAIVSILLSIILKNISLKS